MRRLATLFAALLATSTAFAADAPTPPMPLESVLLYPVRSEIDLDASGDVTGLRVTTPIADDVRAGLDRVIRGWDIEPVLDDGQPVAANTKVDIILAAEPADVVTKMRVDNIRWRELSVQGRPPVRRVAFARDGMRRPQYPTGVYNAGISARVLVAVQVDAKGRVVAAQPVQTALFDVKGKPEVLGTAVDLLEKAVMRVAKTWRLEVTIAPGTTPTAEDMTVYVPIQFRGPAYAAIKPGEWRLMVRTPNRTPAWFAPDPTRDAIGVADIDGDSPAMAEKGPRIRNGGAGQTL